MRETVLRVEHLMKVYPKFVLRDLSFSVNSGSIMGLFGRDGAGKTTALKCVMGLVRPTAGTVRFFGADWNSAQTEIKQRIGYAEKGMTFYPRKKVKEIAAVTRRFYPGWSEEAYQRSLRLLDIDPDRPCSQLREGTEIKLGILLALGHGAEMLLLDDPTDGINPAAREEMVELLRTLRRENIAVVFSTGSAADMDRCADDITYLREGQEMASEQLVDFINYRRMRGFGATLEKIMLQYEKETRNESATG